MKRWLKRRLIRIVSLVGIGSLWILDVALIGDQVTNGFWDVSSSKAYHITLWVATLAFAIMVLIDDPR